MPDPTQLLNWFGFELQNPIQQCRSGSNPNQQCRSGSNPSQEFIYVYKPDPISDRVWFSSHFSAIQSPFQAIIEALERERALCTTTEQGLWGQAWSSI